MYKRRSATIKAGARFGRLLVVSLLERRASNGALLYSCECDCGLPTEAYGSHLRSGATQSCGCLSKERTRAMMTTHGASQSPEYRVWASMKARCYYPSQVSYAFYGALGIRVCTRWRESFAAFLADVGTRPTVKHSIERIDGKGDYEPGNVRWATQDEQANNRKSNIRVEIDGQTATLTQWARQYGLKPRTVIARYNLGHRGCSLVRPVEER